jgi:hypothetical protein
MMNKRIIAGLLAGVLAAGLTTTGASAAVAAGTTVTGTGTGTVYSPADIVDVIVPTSFNIAFNPLKVAIPADEGGSGLTGSTQILSGTYAIQNRSTVPVNVAAVFTVKGDTTAQVATADQVAATDALSDPKAAQFSLDLVTTAKGAAQTLPSAVAEKASDSTTKLRTDDAATGSVKQSKASTKAIALTNVAAATANNTPVTVNFMMAAGPYTAKYDTEKHTVTYQVASNATYDTVAFSFTGTTTTNTANWAKVSKAPTVTATYTLTESNAAAYAATAFDPNSKDVVVSKGDVTVTSSAAGTYTFTKAQSFVQNTDKTDFDYTKNKVTVLSLLNGSKATALTFEAAGITIKETDGVYTATIAQKTDSIPLGFYQFTIGTESFIVEVK